MKKGKLLLAALLLTSVGALASCNTTQISSSVSTEEQVGIVDGINVRKVDKDIVVGDEINLEDYVTFTSEGKIVNSDFEAILTTPTTAILSGHKLTIIAEGNVNVRINVNDESARFNFDAISSIKSKFKSVTQNVGKKYYVDNVTIENGELVLTNKGFLHNDYYFAYCYDPALFPGEDLGGLENTWTGLMRNFYTDTYNFTMDDINGSNLEVHPGIQNDLSNYYLNSDFPLNYNQFKTNGDTLLATNTKVVDNYLSSAMGIVYSPSQLGYSSYGLLAQFDNVKTTKGEVKEVLYVTVFVYNFTEGGVSYTLENPYPYITNAILFEKDFYSVPTLNTYIANRKAPTPLSHTDIIEAFKPFTETKTYTVENSLYFTNYKNELIADPLNEALPIETYNTYVGPNGWITELASGQVAGLVSNNNAIYEVSNADANGNLTSTITTDKYPDNYFANNDVWGGELDHYLTAIFSSQRPYSPINILSNEVDGDTRTITVGAIGSDFFYAYAFYNIQGYGPSLYESFTDTSQGYSLLLYCTAYVTITANDVTIDVQLDVGDNVLYHMQSKFFDNGIDKVSERIEKLRFN